MMRIDNVEINNINNWDGEIIDGVATYRSEVVFTAKHLDPAQHRIGQVGVQEDRLQVVEIVLLHSKQLLHGELEQEDAVDVAEHVEAGDEEDLGEVIKHSSANFSGEREILMHKVHHCHPENKVKGHPHRKW